MSCKRSHKRKIAFLFPGQGAVPEIPPQEAFAEHPEVGRLYDDLKTKDCPAFADFHQQAEMNDLRAQLGVYGLSYALSQVVRSIGMEPDCVAGYSSGLYGALVAADGCSPEQGTEIVLKAYDCMADCTMETDYAMVATIGLGPETIEELLGHLHPQGWISLLNNRRQIIVSIPRQSIPAFSAACDEAGALRVVELPFERPCHIPPLQPAGEQLLDYFSKSPVQTTSMPFMAGPEPRFLRNPHEIGLAIADQLWHQVNWQRTIKALVNSGVTEVVSIDPTGVLGRIVRWITRDVRIHSIQTSANIKKLQHACSQTGPEMTCNTA